jgi:uncharacterized glyoxalase superfamily protein PhnB
MSENNAPKGYRIETFAAVLGVRDVSAAVAHYRDVLGFTVDFTWEEPPTYAGLNFGEANLHLAQSTRGARSRVCFFCTGLDELFQQLVRKGARITQPITVEPYNMREFWVADLDDNELIFGQSTNRE